MTITYYDKYAIIPKRCNKCNRLFLFEGYNLFYRELGRDSIEMIKCKRCIDNNKKNII
jgi:hypothetical protein